MGWKLSAVIIKTDIKHDDNIILDSLWNKLPKKISDVLFEEAHNPQDHYVYLGYYKNCFILTTREDELVDKFLVKEIPVVEQIFMKLFPNSTIGAFRLESVCDCIGYSILDKNVKQRVKLTVDGETSVDYGSLVKEELSLIEENKTDNEDYDLDRDEEVVSRLWARFTGKNFFEDDNLFKNAIFSAYKFDEEVIEFQKPSFWKKIFG